MKIERIQKSVNDLKFGDIVTIKAPFEENTYLYYNGHNPIAVNGELVKDRMGQTSKFRPVMVIGRVENQLIYAPITSSHKDASSDDFYQYKVIHNQSIPNGHRYTTYVETNSIRELRVNDDWTLPYHTTLEDIDQNNLTRRFANIIMRNEPVRDSYRYATPYGVERYKEHLEGQYERQDLGEKARYRIRDNEYLDLYANGIIKHHYERTLEEVKLLHGISIDVQTNNEELTM